MFSLGSSPVVRLHGHAATGAAPLTVQVSAFATVDPEGDPLAFGWTFGDSATGPGGSGFQTYTTAGTDTIQLADTDGTGDSATVSRSVLVTESENALPTASFNTSATTGAAPLSVVFNATGSLDPDGSISAFLWGFCDGSSTTTVLANHAYTPQGAYILALTVTDNEGGTDTATKAIRVTAHGSQVPVASFTADPTAGSPTLNVNFDASASRDPDGFDCRVSVGFRDGNTGRGETISHAYATSGTYAAVLTVIDDNGTPASEVPTIRVFHWTCNPPLIEIRQI